MSAVHYAGALRVNDANGFKVLVISAGYAACCHGARAVKIRTEGRNTHDRAAVTCKLCLAQIRRSEARRA